jgi:hypothetical protein
LPYLNNDVDIPYLHFIRQLQNMQSSGSCGAMKRILLILARAAQHFHSAGKNLFVANGVTEIAFPAGLSKASIKQHQDLFMIFLVKS